MASLASCLSSNDPPFCFLAIVEVTHLASLISCLPSSQYSLNSAVFISVCTFDGSPHYTGKCLPFSTQLGTVSQSAIICFFSVVSYLSVADGSLPAPDMLRTGQYHAPHYESGSILWNAPVSVELFRTAYARCTFYHLHKASGPSAAVVGVSPPSLLVSQDS